jgi:ELWxxDGT repeat protein
VGASVGGQLLYSGADGRGAEPWVTDGITARPVADIAPGVLGSRPHQVGAVGGVVVFGAHDGTTERVFAWTAAGATEPGSTTALTAKRKYTARQALKRRIVLPVTVRSTSGASLTGGVVTLTVRGRIVGTAPLVDGAAQVRIRTGLKPGKTHRVIATWSGLAGVATGSASTAVKVRVRDRR